MHILAGDIGGTNTRIIYAEVTGSTRRIVAEKSYRSADYDGLIQVIEKFVKEHAISTEIGAACFAVAGPVKSGIAAVTNLPWVISEQQLCESLRTPRVGLMNDFVAVANGISDLQATDVKILQQGTGSNSAALHKDAAIIGAGTGLGASHIVWVNDHYLVHPSESGHVCFAPANALQCELLSWLQTKHEHVSLEMLLSGKGLVTIYHFLHKTTGLLESSLINQAMAEMDPAQVISEHALLSKDELCVKTLEMFVDIYGAAASNVVLSYYPVAELYIAGGIAPKIKHAMTGQRFISAFQNKGLMRSNMEKITIKLIVQDKVGLYGALSNAQQLLVES